MQTIDTVNPIILLAIELSASTWLVAARVPGWEKPHLHRIDGGDTAALLALISSLQARAARGLDATIGVVCCFEAGRDGFWLHRLLTAHGVVCHVLEPTSILVNRRARRAKTDRLDAEGMLRVLAAYLRGDHQACSMVRVPTPEEEDAKRTHREREKLVQERQVERLQKVFEKLGKQPSGTQCPAIDGIIKEADETAGEIEDKAVLDAAIVANAQAVEHYEMCRYGTLIAWPRNSVTTRSCVFSRPT